MEGDPLPFLGQQTSTLVSVLLELTLHRPQTEPTSDCLQLMENSREHERYCFISAFLARDFEKNICFLLIFLKR